MINGRAPARAGAARSLNAHQRPVPVVPCRLPLPLRDLTAQARPLGAPMQGTSRRRDVFLSTTAPHPRYLASHAPSRPLSPVRAASAAAAPGQQQQQQPPPESENDLVIDADAIPPTAALRVDGLLSPIHPHPGPWAPPLLAEDDRAPDEFLRVTSLRPGPIWYPAWMRYRRRDGNDIFWSDRLSRNTLDVPAFERRWTVFSTVWYLINHWRFRGFPPTFRYLIASAYRAARHRLYEGHKRLVLWQCKLESALAARAVERRRQQREKEQEEQEAAGAGTAGSSSSSSSRNSSLDHYGPRPGASFSRLMAMRRLHWQNSPVAELLYLQNVAITGRVHQLPPRMIRGSPPTLFWLF